MCAFDSVDRKVCKKSYILSVNIAEIEAINDNYLIRWSQSIALLLTEVEIFIIYDMDKQ